MYVLLLILIAVLFGFGFLHPIRWVAAAVLVYGARTVGTMNAAGDPCRGQAAAIRDCSSRTGQIDIV